MSVLVDLIKKIVGLECIVIADKEGIPILSKAANQKIPETVLRSGFLSTYAMASFQGRKFGMGENNITISVYSSYQVVQIGLHDNIVTFIGNKDCNIGHILAVTQDLSPMILEVNKALGTQELKV